MIYISTGCSKKNRVVEILKDFVDVGYKDIELSSGTTHYDGLVHDVVTLQKNLGLNLLVHNYFPPVERPFVLNLASQDEGILHRSLAFCERAIDLAAQLGSPFYSVHSGFCVDLMPDELGRGFRKETFVRYEQAEETFIQSIKTLNQGAKEKGVRVLIENNVLTRFNLKNGKNKFLLSVTAQDIGRIMNKLSDQNIGLLLDVAHLFVSSQTLSFDPAKTVEKLAPYIRYVHLSDNDGKVDSNQRLKDDGWYWPPLSKLNLQDVPLVLEVYRLELGEIGEQVELMNQKLGF